MIKTVNSKNCGEALSAMRMRAGQTGEAIEKAVKAVLAEFEITDAVVSLVDKGAFDWVIRARMQAVCCRATETKFNWKGED